GPLCLLRFELGVLTNGRLGTVEMVSEYIKHDQAEEAVNFLNSMNWNTEGRACFACLMLIMNYLLKLPLNSEREGLLEEALGSFYAPSRPLLDATVLDFREPISKLSRRTFLADFMFVNCRYKRFEKAFLLAVDIGAKDLFMVIKRRTANNSFRNEVGVICVKNINFASRPYMYFSEQAEVAKQRAVQIDNEPLTSDTGESYDDEDDLSYTEEDITNDERTRGGAVYHGDEYVYVHNHTLSPQDLMPLGEEDDDGAILMLQGPQRSESITYSIKRLWEPEVTQSQVLYTSTNVLLYKNFRTRSLPNLDLDPVDQTESTAGNLKIVHFGVV
ncbi:unnamed protein product, partial [Porites evermanni]